MNIRPLKNKVALKQVDKESKSASGIFLMGGSDETPEFGVIAVGPDVECVKVHDRVFIEIGKATVVDSGTLIVEDKFIVAVLND